MNVTQKIIIFILSLLAVCALSTTSYLQYRQYRIAKKALDYSAAEISNIPVEEKTPTIMNDELAGQFVELNIGGYILHLNLSLPNNTVVSAESLQNEYSTKVSLHQASRDVRVEFDGRELGRAPIQHQIPELRKDVFIPITVSSNGIIRRYLLQTLPNAFPAYSLMIQTDSQEAYLADYIVGNNSYVFKIDPRGLRFYYQMPKILNSPGGVMNLQAHVAGSKLYYSFFKPVVDHSTLTHGIIFGAVELLNEKFEPVKTIRLLPGRFNRTDSNVENHEFVFIDENHYLVTAALDQVVKIPFAANGYATVKAAYIQEVKDDQVVFEWISTMDSSFYSEASEGNDWSRLDQAADYVHINSVDIDPKDNNLLISMRHQDCVAKIDRTTGKTIWKLGGKGDQFNLTEHQKFKHQHYARYLDDGSILLFDNGNDKKQTRAVRVMLDEAGRHLRSYEEYKIPGFYSPACGSVDLIDDASSTYLFGWGCAARQTMNFSFSEVDFSTGEIKATLKQDSQAQSYRVQKMKHKNAPTE